MGRALLEDPDLLENTNLVSSDQMSTGFKLLRAEEPDAQSHRRHKLTMSQPWQSWSRRQRQLFKRKFDD